MRGSKADDLIGEPDPKRFGRGKRTPQNKAFGEITLDSDSDDEISIISEKITPKPKKKMTLVRAPGKGKVPPPSAARKLPSNLVRVGAGKPGMSKPSSASGPSKKPTASAFDDDDEEDLTCKICHSSFWFKSQLVEHLTKNHNVDNPEKYFKKFS